MKKKQLLTKFLISYALIVSLPIVLILIYYYPYSTNVVKDKASNWNYHVTEQLMNSMNIFTKYVYNLPADLLLNREIKPYMADEDPYQKIIITNEMKKYNITDAFIENTLLYLHNIDTFFTKKGSAYIIDDFKTNGVGYVYENWSVEQLYDDLHTLTVPIVRPVEPVIVPGGHQTNLLSFLLPLPLGGEHSPGALLILVRESTILKMMQSSNDEYNGIFIITDHENRCLVSSITCEVIDSEFNSIVDQDINLAANEITVNDTQYLIAHTVSEMNQWHYIRLLPVSDTISEIRNIQINTILILFTMLLLTMLIIYFSLRFNYHPIKRLVELSANLFDQDNNKSSLDEIETIHYALNQLSATKEQLKEEINQTKPKIRDLILFDLMTGNYKDWDSFSLNADAYSIKFPYEQATVAIVAFHHNENSYTALESIRHYLNTIDEDIHAYVINSLYQNEIILIVSHAPYISVAGHIMELQKDIQNSDKVLIGISQSMNVADIKQLHHAYLQASRSLEQLRFQCTDSIAVYNETQQQMKGIVSYQTELMQSLELAILRYDVHQIRELISHIETFMSGDGAPAHIVRTVYLNTMSILINSLEKFQKGNDAFLHSIDYIFQHRYTLNQMLSIMNDASIKLCELISLSATPTRRISQESLSEIIQKHWSDSNLSLQLMADFFEMSPSNFSYHFKKVMGQNFKEYIDHFRIQKSLQLLKTTQESVECISQKVGYMNSSSFIRSFKKIVGMTPGQYRDHMN